MDVVERIDEIFAFAGAIAGGLAAKRPSGESPALQAELSMLFGKVMTAMKEIQGMTTASDKKVMKKAVEVVIKNERLNKNWAKLLKKYVKQYT